MKITMINQSNKVLNSNITKLVNQPYQYGFSTAIENDPSLMLGAK